MSNELNLHINLKLILTSVRKFESEKIQLYFILTKIELLLVDELKENLTFMLKEYFALVWNES